MAPYYHRKNQNGEGQLVCANVLMFYMLIVGMAVVFITVLSPLLLKLLTNESYLLAYTVVPLIALAYLLKGPFLIFLMGIAMKNKTHWQFSLELVAAIINIIGNFLLIPIIGREAAAITTLLSYAFMAIGSYFMVMKIAPIPNIPVKIVLSQLSIVSLSIIIFYLLLYLDINYIAILIIIVVSNTVASYFLFKSKVLEIINETKTNGICG